LLSLKKQLPDKPKFADEHSFGERFRAWWDGYELEAKPKSSLDTQSDASEGLGADDGISDEPERFPPLDRSSPWPETRQRIAQLVWGDGFVVPGDADSTTDLVQAFGLDSSSNMLEIGSGVGGGTRAIASRFGAYVAGFEIDRWRDGERSEAYGWRIEDAQEALGKLSVEVRVTADESDAYSAKILETWKSFVAQVDDNPLPNELVLPMIDEAEFWARRVAAIQSGNLRLCRMTCLKSRLEE